jgi:tetratricopeptide (TPR) repeat protein
LSLLFQTISAPSMSPEAADHLQAGIDAQRRQDFDTAIKEFQAVTELAPASPMGFLNLGGLYMSKHAFADAIPPLRRATEISPDLPAAHQLLGYALLAQGYAADAIPHLEQVHEYGALGIAELEVARYSEAVQNLQTALEKNPSDPDLTYYLSRASASLSSQAHDSLLAASPATARTHQALGQDYFQLKQMPDAMKEYQQAIAMRPDLPGLHLELGQVYAANSKWSDAESEYRQESKLQPGNGEAAYRLGEALLQQGKMKEATQELQRADRLRPDMSDTLYLLGKAAASTDSATSQYALRRVIEIERDSPLAAKAYFVLAEIHRKQGKTQQATQEMQEFRRLQNLANRPMVSQ